MRVGMGMCVCVIKKKTDLADVAAKHDHEINRHERVEASSEEQVCVVRQEKAAVYEERHYMYRQLWARHICCVVMTCGVTYSYVTSRTRGSSEKEGEKEGA